MGIVLFIVGCIVGAIGMRNQENEAYCRGYADGYEDGENSWGPYDN
ncbi:hypothetical protein ABC255_09560 [Neobacillus sp. 3P2-tot-E-2]